MNQKVQPGDIFYSSWGYEQTNIDFYEVVKATEKTVWLVELKKNHEPAGFMTEYVTPRKGEWDGEIFYRRLSKYSSPDKPMVSINSCANAYLWDGTAEYASHYA